MGSVGPRLDVRFEPMPLKLLAKATGSTEISGVP